MNNSFSRFYLKAYPLLFKVFKKLRLPTYQLNSVKHSIIKNHILGNYGDLLSKYKNETVNSQETIREDSPIWVMWWQGEEAMPDIVKICYASIRKNAGKHPVHLITAQNYKEFLTGYPYNPQIEQFFSKKMIGVTHFSDIIRFCLLYIHGGIWLDSTLYITKPIDDFIPHIVFYSGKRIGIKSNDNVPQGKWTSYLCAGGKHNPLFSYLSEMLQAHILRACLNFPISLYYPVSFEFVSGLFSRFYASDSPLSSL